MCTDSCVEVVPTAGTRDLAAWLGYRGIFHEFKFGIVMTPRFRPYEHTTLHFQSVDNLVHVQRSRHLCSYSTHIRTDWMSFISNLHIGHGVCNRASLPELLLAFFFMPLGRIASHYWLRYQRWAAALLECVVKVRLSTPEDESYEFGRTRNTLNPQNWNNLNLVCVRGPELSVERKRARQNWS